MTPNPNPQTLADLLSHAEHYAEFNLRYRASLPGALFLLTPKGPALFVARSLADEDAKTDFAANARLLSVAHGATAAVIALEAWAVLAAPGAPIDPNQPPSLSPGRLDVVALMGEAPGIHQVRFLPILRDAAQAFTGFGEPNVIHGDHTKGIFARILPPRPPTLAEQARAQAILQTTGIVATMPAAERPKARSASRPRHRFSC